MPIAKASAADARAVTSRQLAATRARRGRRTETTHPQRPQEGRFRRDAASRTAQPRAHPLLLPAPASCHVRIVVRLLPCERLVSASLTNSGIESAQFHRPVPRGHPSAGRGRYGGLLGRFRRLRRGQLLPDDLRRRQQRRRGDVPRRPSPQDRDGDVQ